MKKILLIEDKEEVRRQVSEILRLSGYEVMLRSEGHTAIDLALRETPDLILCDIDLPAPDGYAILHAVQQHAAIRDLPMIFLGAFPEKEDLRKAMTAGADDCLPLPFDAIELLRAVEACFLRKSRRQLHLEKRKKDSPAGLPAPFDQQQLAALFGDRDIVTCKKKQTLYSEGQRATQVWFTVAGKVKTFRVHEDGKELITSLYGPGDLIGYSEVLQGDCYRDNARSVDDTQLIAIPRQEFMQLVASSTGFSRLLLQSLARKSTVKDEGLLDLAYNSLRKRVANGLLRLSAVFGRNREGRPAITISRENLAALIGAAPESLTRTLSDFKKEQLISMMDGVISLLDEDRLRNMAN